MNPELRTRLIEIYFQSLEAMDPERLVAGALRFGKGRLEIGGGDVPLYEGTKIWVMGAGKAAASMAAGVEKILWRNIYDGMITAPAGIEKKTGLIQHFEGEHPLTGPNSLAATLEMTDLAGKVAPGDVVLFLLSGGASALFEHPADGIEPEDLKTVSNLLLGSGANITEMNTVRKHLSMVKGGQFLKHLRYARVFNLILSDVPGNDLTDIGSGPTNPDPTTFADACAVLNKYDLEKKVPVAVLEHLRKGLEGLIADTLKPGQSPDCEIRNVILATSTDMAETVKRKLRNEGYSARGVKRAYSGSIGEIAERIFTDIEKVRQKRDGKKPVALVWHGESYVEVTGNGKGGRNTELALRIAVKIAGMQDVVFLSAATDGADGNTGAAGAICDGNTTLLGEKMNMLAKHYIIDNDSWSYFKSLGQIVHTGPTGNNLMDLQIALIGTPAN
jgi:glycerate 2-kinase